MPTVNSEFGQHTLFDHFCGPEIVVATASAYGAQYSALGPYRVTGDLVETDSGVVGLSKAGGFVRLTSTNEAEEGIFVGTEVVLSPALNGQLVCECRLETQLLTARNLFVGFMGVNADKVAPPVVGSTVTLTLTAAAMAGFVIDSDLTAAATWHMPYNGGSATAPTASTSVTSGVAAVAAVCDVLRVEIDPNGTVRWYINGVLKQTVANAVSTSTLLAAGVGVFSTTITIADADVDYLAVRFNTDYTQ